jgi:hypothetical protein
MPVAKRRKRIRMDHKKVYYIQYGLARKRLKTALTWADFEGWSADKKLIVLEQHEAVLRILRIIHNVRQPRPCVPKSVSIPSFVVSSDCTVTVQTVFGPTSSALVPSNSLEPPAPPSSSKVGAALLAFHYTDDTVSTQTCPDRIRLDALQDSYPGFSVSSCSEQKNRGPTRIPHVDTDFKSSLRTALNTVRPQLVLLDYFWLEAGYYIEKYGIDWFIIRGKVWEAFLFGFDSAAETAADANKGVGERKRLAGLRGEARERRGGTENAVQVMILPCDIGRNGSSSMAVMLEEKNLPLGVDIEEISMEDAIEYHPLVRATLESHVDQTLRAAPDLKDRYHSQQVQRLAVPYPFVVIFRQGLAWRDWLTARRTIAEGGVW